MPFPLLFQSAWNQMRERRSSLISSTSLQRLPLMASRTVWVEESSQDMQDGGRLSTRMPAMALMQRTRTGQREFPVTPPVFITLTMISAVPRMLRAIYSSPTCAPYLRILVAQSRAFRHFQLLSSPLFKQRNIRQKRLRCFRSRQPRSS